MLGYGVERVKMRLERSDGSDLIAIVNKALVDIGYLYPLILLLSW
jgi:hypothetical protein